MTSRTMMSVLVASAVASAFGGCNFVASDDTVASKYVKTLPLAAGEGGVLEVTSTDSAELAGTRLEIPPGSVAAGTTITLSLQRQSITTGANTALGPVAVFGPAGLVFSHGARLTLPMRPDATVSSRDLYVEVLEENGERRRIEELQVAADSKQVSVSIAGFTRFQVAAVGCDANTPCAAGLVCESGRCRVACGGITCAADEICVNGRCEQGCPSSCDAPPTSCHEAVGQCDPATLRCVYAPRASGTACDDGNACTTQDSCEAGVCAGTPKACGDNQHCAVGGACECDAGFLDCDGLATSGCEHGGTTCPCAPESDASFCGRKLQECGPLAGLDNCGLPRSVDCGGCGECSWCRQGTCALGCCSETEASFCTRLGKECGLFAGYDNCAVARTVDCGTCAPNHTCDATTNACVCAPETDADFCQRLARVCGPVTATDNCGTVRSVASCGTCGAGTVCDPAANACVCVPESDADLCQRLGAVCGPASAVDNCGAARTVASCGVCAPGEQCLGSGQCSTVPPANDTCAGAEPLVFHPFTNVAIATGSTATAADDARSTCNSSSPARDVAYSFTLPQPSMVDVKVQPGSGSNWRPAVHLRSDCADIATEQGCGWAVAGGSATLSSYRLPPGTYYVWVDGVSATDAGPFSVTVEVRPGGVPPNDACFGARPLLFTGGVALITDDTTGAVSDAWGSCGGNAGADLVYGMTFIAPSKVAATITRTAGAIEPLLYLRSACDSPTNEIACGANTSGTATLSTGVLQPGTYYLWVDSRTTALGSFDLSVTLTP